MAELLDKLPLATMADAQPTPAADDDLPGAPFSVVVVHDAAGLAEHRAHCERLAERALEPNVFYEALALQPALELLVDGAELAIVLVYGTRRKYPAGPQVLCGLFPLEVRSAGPLRHLRFWKHRYCFFNTPLVREDSAAAAIETFLDWLPGSGAYLMQFNAIAGEGAFHDLLVATLHRRGLRSWLAERYVRAKLARADDAEAYMQQAIDRKHRHEARRLRRRLGETGTLETTHDVKPEALDAWLEEFLRLEAQGWKGRTATAMACGSADREYFCRLMHGAARRGRLSLVGLRLEGRPIALGCNLLAGDGGFAFKIAHDESLHRYSPGVLLEMDKIVRFHELPGVRWIDSCADPDHPMIDRLWRERRTIENLWIATGRRGSELLLALAPAARWCRDKLRRRTRTNVSATDPRP